MARGVIITREIAPLPRRADTAHKGDVGRVSVIGGCWTADAAMIGAPALTANAAFRTGSGLVQLVVPEELRISLAVLAPCATFGSLRASPDALAATIDAFGADVLAIGPGLGRSLTGEQILETLRRLEQPVVLDADGMNRVAEVANLSLPKPERMIVTPHPGEARRLLVNGGLRGDIGSNPTSRKEAAVALARLLGCVVVLKGKGTVVTNGRRLYVNETGNSGMATGGTGDVLTGVIASLVGQGLDPLEAAILGVYLHGLAGDFAAEELGRHSLMALDVLDYLPEALCEHATAAPEE